jgi:hypothetical protein
MRIDAIAIGKDPPSDVNVIVEVPTGGEPIKYEMDKEAGTVVVDRFLPGITASSRILCRRMATRLMFWLRASVGSFPAASSIAARSACSR